MLPRRQVGIMPAVTSSPLADPIPYQQGAFHLTSAAGFQLLEHTADVGIEAWATSLEGLFEEMAKGLKTIVVGESPAGQLVFRAIELTAEDIGQLLVMWLNEIIYLFDTVNLVPAMFEIDRIEGAHLRATICGEMFDPLKHRIKTQAKAATYHQLLLTKRVEGWLGRIYIDL